jgi:hypothetical protein
MEGQGGGRNLILSGMNSRCKLTCISLVIQCIDKRFLVAVLGNPKFWALSWEALKNITVQSFLPMLILDFYLLARYLDSPRNHGCHYVNVATYRKLQDGVPVAELRDTLSLPQLGTTIEMVPVVLLVDVSERPHHEKLALLILNYELGKVIILDPADQYRGDIQAMWMAIGRLFNWKTIALNPSIFHEQWITVSHSLPQVQILISNRAMKHSEPMQLP